MLAETPTNNPHSLADQDIVLQGQYCNSATDPNTAADNSNKILPQKVKAIATLPSASDSDTLLEGTYIDHNTACSSDGACHDQIDSTNDSVGCECSEPVHSTAPSHASDENASFDTSNHFDIPVTGVYQSNMDNDNCFQTIPVDAVPSSTVTDASNLVGGSNTDFPTSHSTTAISGEYVSHNETIEDVLNTDGFVPQNIPSSQGIVQSVNNHSLSEVNTNSVSSLPYVLLTEDSNTIPTSSKEYNTQAAVAAEFLPYSTTIRHNEKVTDSTSYLPYHVNDPSSHEVAKDSDLQFLSNGYVTTSM